MTKQEVEKIIEENKQLKKELFEQRTHDASLLEMQKAFTTLANNYSEFIGKMNKIIDKAEPLIDATIEKFKEEI